jgi:hypothetical protein
LWPPVGGLEEGKVFFGQDQQDEEDKMNFISYPFNPFNPVNPVNKKRGIPPNFFRRAHQAGDYVF